MVAGTKAMCRLPVPAQLELSLGRALTDKLTVGQDLVRGAGWIESAVAPSSRFHTRVVFHVAIVDNHISLCLLSATVDGRLSSALGFALTKGEAIFPLSSSRGSGEHWVCASPGAPPPYPAHTAVGRCRSAPDITFFQRSLPGTPCKSFLCDHTSA